jgi:hypothetical protein
VGPQHGAAGGAVRHASGTEEVPNRPPKKSVAGIFEFHV